MIKISPSYSQDQLDGGEITMVDVYADIVTNCIFRFADSIVFTEHSGIAVLILLTTVFEPLGGILRGADPCEIKKNFVEGFDWILQRARGSSDKKLAERIYGFVRCGLFHEGFIKPRICLTDSDEAVAEKDGVIIIDPRRLCHETEEHFGSFVTGLKGDETLRRNFYKYWKGRDKAHQKQLRNMRLPTVAVYPPIFNGTLSPSPGPTLLATGDGLTNGEED